LNVIGIMPNHRYCHGCAARAFRRVSRGVSIYRMNRSVMYLTNSLPSFATAAITSAHSIPPAEAK